MNQALISDLVKPLIENLIIGVSLFEHEGKTTPRFWDDAEFVYVGIDDNKNEIAYLRELEDVETVQVDNGGCHPDYELKHYDRLVIYNRDFKQNKANYILKLIGLLSNKDITVKRIIDVPNKVARLEHSFKDKNLRIGESGLYIAVDIVYREKYNTCCPDTIDICEPEKINCI